MAYPRGAKVILIPAVLFLFAGCLTRYVQKPESQAIQQEEEILESEPSVEQVADGAIVPLLPETTIGTSIVKRWPADRDIVFFVTYRDGLKLLMQWRQLCPNGFDTDWYDMLGMGRATDPLDTSYLIKSSTLGDTVIVLVQALKRFPRSGCEWSFRFRLTSERNISPWVVLAERIILIDPGEFEQIDKPRVQIIKDASQP